MQRARTTIIAGLALAAGVWSGAAAQVVRTQDLTFGGGSHFDFAVPVGYEGRIAVAIQVPDGIPVEGYLFSPRGHDYVAMARGVGSLRLSHAMAAADADAGEWRLDVVLPTEHGTAVGTVRVTWPAAGTGEDVVTWLNAGPTDPGDLAAIADGLERLHAYAHQTNGGSLGDPAVDRIAAALGTRVDVLSGMPARYVRNDYASESVIEAPVRVTTGRGPLSVSLVEFAAYQQGYWHPGRTSDRSYVVAVVLPPPGEPAVGGQSKLYRFVCGDPYSRRVNPVKVTHGTGEVPLLPAQRSLPSGEMIVAVLEREHAGGGSSLPDFMHGAALFAAYRAQVGTEASRVLPWLIDVALGRGDAVVGTPRLITIEGGAPADTLVDRHLEFVQSDAAYGVTLRVLASTR